MPGNNGPQIEGGGESLDARRKAAALLARRKAAAAKRAGSGVNTTSADGIAKASGTRTYRARKGDSLWSIAEKTKPSNMSTGEYWTQLKKLNSTNGKVNRLFVNSAVKLPSTGIVTGDAGYSPKNKPSSGMPKAK